MEMMRNPHAMQQAMRSQDLMMSQLENHPLGFNALRRMQEDIADPMMQAAADAQQQQAQQPNPWAAPAAPVNTTSPNTSAMPNPWGGGAQGAAVPNPWGANSQGAFAGMPGMGGYGGAGGLGGMGGFGGMDPNQMSSMMSNPMVQQQMAMMMNNPAMLQQMASMNPQLAPMLNNPQVRAMLSNPALMQQMMNPANLQVRPCVI